MQNEKIKSARSKFYVVSEIGSLNYTAEIIFGSADSINIVLTTTLRFALSLPAIQRTLRGASFCGSLDNYSIASNVERFLPSAFQERGKKREREPRNRKRLRRQTENERRRIDLALSAEVIFAFLLQSRTHARTLLLDFCLKRKIFHPLSV